MLYMVDDGMTVIQARKFEVRNQFYNAYQEVTHQAGLPGTKPPTILERMKDILIPADPKIDLVIRAEKLIEAVVLSEQSKKGIDATKAAASVRDSDILLAMYATASSHTTSNRNLRDAVALQNFAAHRNTPFQDKGLEAMGISPQRSEMSAWTTMVRQDLAQSLKQKIG